MCYIKSDIRNEYNEGHPGITALFLLFCQGAEFGWKKSGAFLWNDSWLSSSLLSGIQSLSLDAMSQEWQVKEGGTVISLAKYMKTISLDTWSTARKMSILSTFLWAHPFGSYKILIQMAPNVYTEAKGWVSDQHNHLRFAYWTDTWNAGSLLLGA